MKSTVTVKPNPSKQERDKKVLEVSFTDENGYYKGLLISLRFAQGEPIINLYRIDKGINIYVNQERE